MAWPLIFSRCGDCWTKALGTFAHLKNARYDRPRILLELSLKYKCRFIPGHIEKGEKGKHFSYPNYFTYHLLQHWSIGQRCPDNRGCTVPKLRGRGGGGRQDKLNSRGMHLPLNPPPHPRDEPVRFLKFIINAV